MNPIKAANPITVTKRAVGLAGAVVGLAGTVAREAVHAPVAMTRGAIHLADTAAGIADNVAHGSAHLLRTDQGDQGDKAAAHPGVADSTMTDKPNIAGATTAAAAVSDVTDAPPDGAIVTVEQHTPTEPPIDVVGAALAAEAAAKPGEGPDSTGIAHEPRGASRDEEHGDAALQRAEQDEIAEEAAAALEGDVEPEEQLAEQLLDSGDARAMAAESATMSKAANVHKG